MVLDCLQGSLDTSAAPSSCMKRTHEPWTEHNHPHTYSLRERASSEDLVHSPGGAIQFKGTATRRSRTNSLTRVWLGDNQQRGYRPLRFFHLQGNACTSPCAVEKKLEKSIHPAHVRHRLRTLHTEFSPHLPLEIFNAHVQSWTTVR